MSGWFSSAWAVGSVNLFASVSIILVNKQIVSACGFSFIITVLTLNFLTTGAFTEILARRGVFEVKHLPARDRWLMALLAMLTVLLNNASNEANSVGFYQITKLLIVPTVIFFERLGGVKRSYSRNIILSLLVAAVGVAVATVSDFQINVRGSILAVLSILLTAKYQMWQGSKQHEHGLSAMQITHSVTWPQALLGTLTSLLLDVSFPFAKKALLLPSKGLLDHDLQSDHIFWIVACCLVAVVMNISTYGILGKVTPVTYQVLGQFKTCLIIGFGYLFFDAKVPASWLAVRLCGVAIAVGGILSYAIAKNEEQKQKKT